MAQGLNSLIEYESNANVDEQIGHRYSNANQDIRPCNASDNIKANNTTISSSISCWPQSSRSQTFDDVDDVDDEDVDFSDNRATVSECTPAIGKLKFY